MAGLGHGGWVGTGLIMKWLCWERGVAGLETGRTVRGLVVNDSLSLLNGRVASIEKGLGWDGRAVGSPLERMALASRPRNPARGVASGACMSPGSARSDVSPFVSVLLPPSRPPTRRFTSRIRKPMPAATPPNTMSGLTNSLGAAAVAAVSASEAKSGDAASVNPAASTMPPSSMRAVVARVWVRATARGASAIAGARSATGSRKAAKLISLVRRR